MTDDPQRAPLAARGARAAWIAYWGAMRRYHRYDVEGFEHLLSPGSALLVGYHGRPIAHDLCMLTVTMYERLGYLPHGVVHRFFGDAPILGPLVAGLGFVAGDGPAIRRAVDRGEHVLVQPGGTREGCRSFRHRYRVDWGDRMGYLRLALRHKLRIVPVAGAGVDDAFVGFNDGYALGKRLGMPARIPLWMGVGLTGVWPLSLPLPVKMTQIIGRPIDLATDGTVDPADPRAMLALHRKVIDAVQELLDRSNARSSAAGAHRGR